MRTVEEISADVHAAMTINDADALSSLAAELDAQGTPNAEAIAANARGVVSRLRGDYASALEHFRRALQVYDELGDRRGAAQVTSNMGNVYYSTGNYLSALEHHRRALQVHEEFGDRPAAATVTGNLGNVYLMTGDYPAALEQYRHALKVHEELGDHTNAARVTGCMGSVFLLTGDYQSALEHYGRALQVQEELGERAGAVNNIQNMGNVYSSTGDHSSALEHYGRALQVYEELGSRAGVALVTGNMVFTLLESGDHRGAAELLERQSTMLMDSRDVLAQHHANRSKLAEAAGDPERARELLHQALKVAEEAGVRNDVAEYHQRLRDLAKQRNDFEGYIHHNDEYLRISEEIRGKEATQKMAMMEAERRIEAELRERDKERALLYGALPESVATRMLRGEDVSGDHFANASVLFMDIAGFTTISDRIPPGHVVHLLKAIFNVCDDVCVRHGLTKIKTIGDSYLAVAGVPEPLNDHAQRAARAALDMLKGLNDLQLVMDPKLGDTSWTQDVGVIQVRIGLHCGPLVAGIVGEQRLQYDVWGDTVNVASRMESTGEPGRIQVSDAFAQALKRAEGSLGEQKYSDNNGLRSLVSGLRYRGETEVKGKGTMTTYWLEQA